jgi:hypothetical protein
VERIHFAHARDRYMAITCSITNLLVPQKDKTFLEYQGNYHVLKDSAARSLIASLN